MKKRNTGNKGVAIITGRKNTQVRRFICNGFERERKWDDEEQQREGKIMDRGN